jgi:hypothetical protein
MCRETFHSSLAMVYNVILYRVISYSVYEAILRTSSMSEG